MDLRFLAGEEGWNSAVLTGGLCVAGTPAIVEWLQLSRCSSPREAIMPIRDVEQGHDLGGIPSDTILEEVERVLAHHLPS